MINLDTFLLFNTLNRPVNIVIHSKMNKTRCYEITFDDTLDNSFLFVCTLRHRTHQQQQKQQQRKKK